MPVRSAADLLSGVAPVAVAGSLERPVAGVRGDSRAVRAGELFVALAGRAHDGHAYLDQAYARGAVVAVGQRPHAPPAGRTYVHVADSRLALSRIAAAWHGHPTRRLYVVGVTGTKGKTTVAHGCATLLGDAVCLSTVTNPALGIHNTTPGPLDVQRLAAEALAAGKRHLVLEVSAHGLVQQRVADVAFAAAAFTNLSQDHFDDFSGFEATFRAKARLFEGTHPAVVNADDAYGRRLIAHLGGRAVGYGLGRGAQVRAEGVRLARDGSRFTVSTPSGAFALHTRLPGRFNVYNLLAAAGVGWCAGLDLAEMGARLSRVTGVAGRLERLITRSGVWAVVDFAHSPDSLAQVIAFLKAHYPRVVTLFGCGGESDPFKRPLMGRLSGELSDHTVLTHDNPKREDPQKILDQIERGIRAVTARYEVVPDRRAAIRRALELARPGDCVLVAGKGHETVQEFADGALPFNDADFLVAACGARRV